MASSRANSSTASGSIGSAPVMPTDIRAPLWDHVTILEPAKTGGGNTKWKCNYCPMSKVTSYTRVEAQLLQFKDKGIVVCPNVSFEMLSHMRAEVKRCQDLVEKARERSVSLPTEPAPIHCFMFFSLAALLDVGSLEWKLEKRKESQEIRQQPE